MAQNKINPLVVQLPAIGLVLGVLFSTFIGVLFQLNLGVTMVAGILIGVTVGTVIRLLVTGGQRRSEEDESEHELINPDFLN